MRGFSADSFMSYISENNGIATNGLYKVEIARPMNKGTNSNTTLLCHTASLMGKGLNVTSSVYGYGSEFQLPVNETFEDLTLSFNTTMGKDGKLPERTFFNNWINEVINPISFMSGFKKDYASDIDIYLLDNAGNKGYRQKYKNCIPTTISDIELSSSARETISFDVTFTFDKWLENDMIKEKEETITN